MKGRNEIRRQTADVPLSSQTHSINGPNPLNQLFHVHVCGANKESLSCASPVSCSCSWPCTRVCVTPVATVTFTSRSALVGSFIIIYLSVSLSSISYFGLSSAEVVIIKLTRRLSSATSCNSNHNCLKVFFRISEPLRDRCKAQCLLNFQPWKNQTVVNRLFHTREFSGYLVTHKRVFTAVTSE